MVFGSTAVHTTVVTTVKATGETTGITTVYTTVDTTVAGYLGCFGGVSVRGIRTCGPKTKRARRRSGLRTTRNPNKP